MYYIVENVDHPLPFVVSEDELYWDDYIVDGPFDSFADALDELDMLWLDIDYMFDVD